MHKKFDHKSIEKKWRQRWDESGIYRAGPRDDTRQKEYVLVEWPYPSGNLHIGHWYAFAVPDIYVRARRMQGIQTLFPIGFDAFGLPAENAAIKRNVDPKAWTDDNIAYMKQQLASMGNAFTWDYTANSTDPAYYRWTQWMFIQFFKNGIAYRGAGIVNWCPSCNTVLANEQVANEHCERCGAEVEKRTMDEWKLRITQYADRLIDDLDALDWPEPIKEAQRNWIGRSSGAQIPFTLSTGDTLDVFTTRPDTIYGATYLVLAPEHTLIEQLRPALANGDDVDAYRRAAAQRSDIERTGTRGDKTGVKLSGVSATNPATGDTIPVFIADYVLAHYGTGAIMAVPAHDERDFAFAAAHDVPVVQVIEAAQLPFSGHGTLMNSGKFSGSSSEAAQADMVREVGGSQQQTYRLRDWSIGRQRYWGTPIPIVYDPDGTPHPVPNEHLPWLLPTDVDFRPTGEPPLKKSVELRERTERIFGAGWTPEVETMDTFVDSSWYFLRYIDIASETSLASLASQRDWMPVDLYFGGAEHTTMHLLYSRFWQKALFDLGLTTADEPYRRRFNRSLVLGPDGNKMSKSKGNVIDPDEQVERLGADTVKMYLAFMGPYGEVANYPWDMGGISGIRRFLERVNGLSEHVTDTDVDDTVRLLHRTIQKVRSDIDVFKFNTAISALMIFVHAAEKSGLSHESYRAFLRLLAPFAPHLAEELWEACGQHESIHAQQLPEPDPEMLVRDTVTIAVQINGKVRGAVELAADAAEDDARAAAAAEPKIAEHLSGREVVRTVYVPGRILSIITT